MLPPVDKVPITDYLLAQNWRVDALGRLISRAGYASKLSITGAGLAHSAGSFGGVSSPLYVGCNSGISNPTSAVYYNQNATPIATGFDGNRIGFASQNGFMWIMNRGKQGRHSVANGFQPWNLTPPPASATVAGGGSTAAISAATNATPVVFTTTAAPASGPVILSGFTGTWAVLNGPQTATNISGTTFSVPVDSTAFGAMTGTPLVTVTGSPAPSASATYTYSLQGTTVAASIALGLQTVTPVSMAGISVGMNLGVSNSDFSNYEIVVVAAITGATFDATYTKIKTGPGIIVGFYNYVHSLTIAGTTYSFQQNGYSNAQIPNVMAGICGGDPNCSVTYPGSGNNVLITPIPAGTLIPISGSDGNTPENLANGAVTSLPNGTYQFYLTFVSADLSLESNPSPASAAVQVTAQAIVVTIPGADAPVDTRIGFVRIYATGGTLGAAYQVGQLPSTVSSPATLFTDTIPDLQATANGVVMPTTNDPAPAASGIIGPHFSRLYCWSTAANPNRLFYTDADLPQYFPGSADSQVGNWVDVGDAGEAIIWCSIHTNMLVIYKERTIWMMIGSDPGTATLEKVYEGCGLSGQFALAPAGMIDYFVGPNALYIFDMNAVHEVAGAVLPIFNRQLTYTGATAPPGSILPGTAFNSTSTASYAVALGHANGKLYVSYAELGGTYNLLVYNEGNQPETNAYVAAQPGKWFYHRNAIAGTGVQNGFFGFFFDGTAMIGLTGAIAGAAAGYNVDDFRGFLTEDLGTTPIVCTYQSHFENDGTPEIPKTWLEVVVDIELIQSGSSNDAAIVDFAPNNGSTFTTVGTIATPGRSQVSFSLGAVEAKNASILINVASVYGVILHNVFLYFYEEVRYALVATTLPTDLGVGKVKQCKELELDIAAPNGTVAVVIQSDLPGNALASRQTPTVASAGRAIKKFPFGITEGLLWKIILTGNSSKTFQLYSARLLMRVMAVYVEGYESTAGFVWDSMQQDLGTGDVNTFDQIRFDMEAGGASSVTMLTDLPGEAFAVRGGGALTLTAGATSRAWVTVPLPDPYGASAIEGRSVQLQVSGNTGFKLYKAQVRSNRIGRYLMGTAPDAANDAFTTLEFDFSTERAKAYKRLEIDMRAAGTVNMSVITDQSGTLAVMSGPTGLATTGRQTLMVPMPPGIRGRLLRLILTSTAAARVYRIRVWTRPLSEPNGAWKWEDFPLEASDVVPTWKDLIAEETSPVWQWVDVPFEVTEA